MIAYLVLGGMILIGTALAGAFFFLKKQKAPLTPASIPPIPSPQEANQHFTPASPVLLAQTKPPMNKKILIGVAVLFNIILIGTVVIVGQSVSKKKTELPVAQTSTATPTPRPTLVPSQPIGQIPIAVESPTPEQPADLSPTVAVIPTAEASPTAALVAQAVTPTVAVTVTPLPTTVPVAVVEATVAPTAVVAQVTTPPLTSLPTTGSPLTYLFFIVPAFLVALAFIL